MNSNAVSPLTQNTITFQTMPDSTWVLRITADRRIEVNEDVEVTEAAKKVLEAVQFMLNQQRPWVSLTDDDIFNALPGYPVDYKEEFARAIEAKLKEKNNPLTKSNKGE